MNKLKTVSEKREYIRAAISRNNMDKEFIRACVYLSSSNHNLDKVINDIDQYNTSIQGVNYAYAANTVQCVNSWENVFFITLTTRYEESKDKLEQYYIRLVRELSKLYLKNAFKRNNKLIDNIGYIEAGEGQGDREINLHIHAVFSKPHFVDNVGFTKDIKDAWHKYAGMAHVQMIEESKEDKDNVALYMTKLHTKTNGMFLTLQDAYLIC